MNRSSDLRRWVAALALAAAAAGCSGELDVENPNAPDTERAFIDPATIASLASGTIRQWALTRHGEEAGLVLNTMADHTTASWNNFNLRYYSSYGFECPQRCAWANDLTSPIHISVKNVDAWWYPYYSALSSANDALVAIRKNGVVIQDAPTTKMYETIAVMMQGFVYGGISLIHDQGFAVDEDTDLSDPLGLPLLTRLEMRDAAITKLDSAWALANRNSFNTPTSMTGEFGGRSYTNTEIAKLIRTIQAEILAQWPRNAAENAQVDWGKVRTFASQGVSSAGGRTFEIEVDQATTAWDDGLQWFVNDAGWSRVDTRLASIITAGPDPAKVHKDPWPTGGNPQPDAYDKRVGDGSWGPSDNYQGHRGKAATPNAGTDFAYAGANYFNPARGQYHQSNLAYIRYSYLAYAGYGLPGEDGRGPSGIITTTYNDLLWAEAEWKAPGGSKAKAAELVNKTRVNRGGLSPLTGGESDAAFNRALQYEQAIELFTLGGVPFFNVRRVTPAGYAGLNNAGCPALLCLWPDTPRHMPIPAKELGLLKLELYTYGGPDPNPEASAGAGGSASTARAKVKNVREIAAEMEARSRELRKRKM